MPKQTSKLWSFVIVVFAIAVTMLTLPGAVFHPWHLVPALGGDGGKNTFTFLFQSMYGKGAWFTGMNYPYGEHIVFTDCQPLLSGILNSLPHRVSMETALAAMWWLISVSYVLSVIFCFKLLVNFNVRPFWAMWFAGLIAVFTPQLVRISGHYGLCYSCILPMYFFWTLQYYKSGKWKYTFYIFITGTLFTFLHPYYAAVTLVWIACYVVSYFVFNKETISAKLRHILPMFFSVVAVFAIFAVFMKLTDPISDRPTTPYGILSDCTTLREIVTSGNSPIWIYLNNKKIYTDISIGHEGVTYIGVVVLLAVCWSLITGIICKRRNTGNKLIDSEMGFQFLWLLMAFIALLFSMGVPFVWHLEGLLTCFPYLRQFRTLGRFSWIFYYIITIYGSVVIYNVFLHLVEKGKNIQGYIILISSLGVWGFEASGYIINGHSILTQGIENYKILSAKSRPGINQFLEEHHYKKEDFQATLILPYFAVGTEKLWISNEDGETDYGIALSLISGIQLHLPTLDAMMSRSSWSQAFKQVKTIGGPYTQKPVLEELKSRLPILLFREDVNDMPADQDYLLNAALFIGQYLNYKVYACYPEKVLANDKKIHDSIASMVNLERDGDTCISGSGTWFINHYQDNLSDIQFLGKRRSHYVEGDDTVLNTIALQPGDVNKWYEFSCWFLVSAEDYKSPVVRIEAVDKSGAVVSTYDAMTKQSTDNNGLWLRDQCSFKIPPQCAAIRCRLMQLSELSFKAIGPMMLIPAGTVIVSKNINGKVFVNNHIFN